MNFRFDHPELLLLLLLAGPIIWLGRRSLVSLDPGRRWLAITLRLAVLLVLTLMLAGLQAVRWNHDLTVVAVKDDSESVRRFVRPPSNLVDSTDTADLSPVPSISATTAPSSQPGARRPIARGANSIERWINAWITRAAADRRPDDRVGAISFDARPTVTAMPATGIDLESSTLPEPLDGTNIGEAISQGLSLFPADSGKRMLLMSDGGDNASEIASGSSGSGDGEAVLAAAREAKAAGVPIDVLPLDYQLEHEVMVDALYAPPEVSEGQTVSLRVVLRATQPTPGKLFIRHDGQIVELNGPGRPAAISVSEQNWSLETRHAAPGSPDGAPSNEESGGSGGAGDSGGSRGQYVRVVVVELPLETAGVNRFEADFDPARGYDTLSENNRAESFTLVRGKSRILLVNDLDTGEGDVLPKALRNLGMQVDEVRGPDLPETMGQLLRYDAVLLQNVPSEEVSPAQQKMLASYVTDMGGGLLMVGGSNGFGAGGWTDTPIDHVLPVECRLPPNTTPPVGLLILTIDRSGSMADVVMPGVTKLDIVVESAVQAIGKLRPTDMVGVVVFDQSIEVIWEPAVLGDTGPQLIAKLRSISYGPGTDIYGAVRATWQMVHFRPQSMAAAVKHGLLLTDGNGGDGDYPSLFAKMAEDGETLSTIGVGDDADDKTLQYLAEMGHGTYHRIRDPRDLPQVFLREARTVARTYIKEAHFVPRVLPTGSPIMQDLDSPPLLKGLVQTGTKLAPGGKGPDPRVFNAMVGPDGEPVFAHWQIGLGRSAAFTSDASNRWAAAWMNWSGYSDFWGRTVRNIARPAQSRDMDLTAAVHGPTLHLRLDAGGAPGAGAAGLLNVMGAIVEPDGSIRQHVALRQTGPALYEADVPAGKDGNYIVSLLAQDAAGRRTAVIGGANRPPGTELRRFSSNLALLQQVVTITGGRMLDPLNPDAAGLFSREGIGPSRSIRPLWRPLLMILVVLFLLDVAARRVSFDAVKAWRWLLVRLAPAGAASSGGGTGATLAGLKASVSRAQQKMERRVEVRVGKTGVAASGRRTPGGGGGAPPSPAVPAAQAQKKFEAPAGATAEEDLAGAVGGARAGPRAQQGKGQGPPATNTPARPPAKPAVPEEPTTNRLLDAKRRLRDQLENPPDE